MTFIIDSPLGVDEAVARMREVTVKRHWIRFWNAVPGTFEGSISGNRFTVLTSAEGYRAFEWIRSRNLGRPVCSGHITPAPGGSRIRIGTRPQAAVILLWLWAPILGGLGLALVYRDGFFEIDGEFRWFGLLFPGVVAFQLIVLASFAREMRHEAQDAFRQVFKGESAMR
jgi:hypothetical protein